MSGVKGKSGRKKTPLAILKKRGSRLDRRTKEVEVLPEIFIAPTEMSAGMKSFYDTYLPLLQKTGIVSVTDSIAFESMARNYARIQALNEKLGDTSETDKLFVTEETKNDTVTRVSAIAKLAKDYEVLLWSQLREFGLTPSSRGNVTKIEIKRDGIKKLT